MRGDAERLADILDAIEKIEKYASRGRETYFSDELIQAWMFNHIQIIGEAAANISRETRRQYPDVPWGDIIAMRNIVVHQYFGIDLQEVWDTIAIDLPVLKNQVREILRRVTPA
jgi:uncharacterized protein with HEPN domain